MESIYLHLGCGARKFDGFVKIDTMLVAHIPPSHACYPLTQR